MIVTAVVGNVADLSTEELSTLHMERVVLPLEALTKRRQRVMSDHGTDIGIQLDAGTHLHDGDILARTAHGVVVVSVQTSDVLVIAPTTIEQMGITAHALGNRHLPAQFFGPAAHVDGLGQHDGVMVIAYDHTAEHWLSGAGVRHLRTQLALERPFRHAEHVH